MTSPPSPPRGLPHVIVMLTHDRALAAALAPLLAARDARCEMQVVADVEHLLHHLTAFTPDALVLDTAALQADALQQVLGQRLAADGPVIILGSAPDTAPPDVVFIAPGPAAAAQIAETLHKVGHVARLHGALAERERHHREILEALNDGVFVLHGGIFTFINRSLLTLLGQNDAALCGKKRLTDFVVQEERGPLAARLASLELSDGTPHELTVHLISGHGHDSIAYEVSARASLVDGSRAVVGVGRDVTIAHIAARELEQTRQRAAQVERLRALGELSAGVAHDFNNALGTILGRISLARDKLSRGESLYDDLQVIELAGKHAADTVQRIQDYSRPSGTDTWKDVDLSALVSESAAFVRTRVPPGVQLCLQTSQSVPIRGNTNELREVLLNLVRNALDAVGEHGRVTVGCAPQGEQTLLWVTDDGDGMDMATQKRIFEPFFSTKGQSGTGLGLSVSHWILRRHDAQIVVESAPGRGTTFRVLFEPFKPAAGTTHRRKIESILVVDDDATVADMMRDLLTDQGFEVNVVGSATAALAALAERSVDLLITDLDLPDLGGWQLARRVHEAKPDTVVGLISGWPLGASQDELKARGISFVLAKPFSLATLAHELARAAEA